MRRDTLPTAVDIKLYRRAKMSEITYQQKELKGLGGWLVLFQIQIWSIPWQGIVQDLGIFIPLSGILMRKHGCYELIMIRMAEAIMALICLRGYNSPCCICVYTGTDYCFLTLYVHYFLLQEEACFQDVFFILESVIYLVPQWC